MRRISIILAFTMTAFILLNTGCSEPDSDKVYNAQACLDKVGNNTDAALACMDKVSGMTSEQANLIRCAAILIYEGLGNPTNLQTAISNLTNSGGANPTATAMNAIAFKKTNGSYSASPADTDKANEAASYCSSSGSTGLSMLAALTQMATIGSNLVFVASQAQNGSNLQSQINSNAASIVSSYPSVTTSLSTAYQQNCTGTITSANQSFCSQYKTAQGSGQDPTTYFLAHLN